jgi:CheY-like chemotaxis protein
MEGRRQRAIAIIDDDPSVLRVLTRVVERFTTFVVQPFSEGAAAMAWLQHHPAELVITDHTMRGPDGLDVVRWIRAQPGFGSVPVLMLTGSMEPEFEGVALAQGVSRLARKPLQVAELLSEIHALTGQGTSASDSTT